MIQAILFDLDGTLLPMDNHFFIDKYLELLSSFMKNYFDPKQFLNKINQSTLAMLSNTDQELTNDQVFRKHFFEQEHEETEYMSLFDSFYQAEYPKLKGYTENSPDIPKIVREVKTKRYKIVVATNPVFPLTAILQRINWAGLAAADFDLITSYENMHYCKPHPDYYQEIAAKIDVKPKECLMVGNDASEDLAAKSIGMSTFLLEDYLIAAENVLWEPDFRGNVQDLSNLIRQLPAVN